jgi:hypothetical protein
MQRVTRLASDGHLARLGLVGELTVRAVRALEHPAVPFDELDDLADLHRRDGGTLALGLAKQYRRPLTACRSGAGSQPGISDSMAEAQADIGAGRTYTEDQIRVELGVPTKAH